MYVTKRIQPFHKYFINDDLMLCGQAAQNDCCCNPCTPIEIGKGTNSNDRKKKKRNRKKKETEKSKEETG